MSPSLGTEDASMQSGNGMVMVTPDGCQRLLSLHGGKIAQLAKHYHVSTNTIISLRDARRIRLEVLKKMVRRCPNTSIGSVLVKDSSIVLPSDPNFFLSMSHSYFIDREPEGDECWYYEKLTWRRLTLTAFSRPEDKK